MRLKLGPHTLPGETGDTAAWCGLNPTVVKLCYRFDALPYIPPGILVVGRADENFIGTHPVGIGDPVAMGAEFAQGFSSLIRGYPRIDVWEASNEFTPANPEEMTWYATMLEEFARQMQIMGKRALIGSFATGNPRPELWPYYVPALRACKYYGAIHARHCYGPIDRWNALRYRDDAVEFAKLGFPHVLVNLSRCGVVI